VKDKLLLFAIALAGGLAGANLQPVLTGAGKILFPGTTPVASISALSGALTIASGGTNQDLTLSPSGTAHVLVPNTVPYGSADSSSTPQSLLWLDGSNPDILHLQNNQRAAGGSVEVDTQAGGGQSLLITAAGQVRIGGGTPSYPLDVGGDVNSGGVFRKGGAAGAGVGAALTVCSAVAGGVCTSSCTLVFNGGIRTGGTCP
jgi:hypothetical protein